MALFYLDGNLFATMIKGGAACLHTKTDTVNQLNVFPVPDGDTGDNMFLTIDGGVCAVSDSSEEDLSLECVSSRIATGMLHGARGNSGVILSQLFAGIAKGFEGCKKADVYTVGKALEFGVKSAYAAVITPTEGTILTVAREAVDYAVSRITKDSTLESLFKDLKSEMTNSLHRTPELLAVLREAGVIDSGGAGLVYIVEGFNQVLNGVKPELIDRSSTKNAQKAPETTDFSKFTEDSVLQFGYCTELLIRLQNKKCDPKNFEIRVIIDFLQTIGDSIVCFKEGSIVKLHVHTMTPEKVLDFCHCFGEFLSVKIENMSLQHNEAVEKDISKMPKKKRERYGTVAVASGNGIEKLFVEMGANYVVRGGQTMNPSSQDFLKAFDEVNADVIFVLPNNSNIILAARQAAGIYTKSKVYVLESRTLGEGYTALSNLNYEPDNPEEIISVLNSAMENITTAMLSKAIRDAVMNSVQIHTGDYLGLIGKEIVSSHPDRFRVAEDLLSHLNLQDKFALTVFAGAETNEESNRALESYIHDVYPDIELYLVNGEQEIYDYILIAE